MSGRAARRLGVLGMVLLSAGFVARVDAQSEPVPGSQGVDTSLPLTDSAATVNGRGRFADLEVTVNQTRNLTNQAVSITWEGGAPTRSGPGRFAANFLQIMQCWGEDDGTVPGNPGPPPEQCVQGAVAGTYAGVGVGSLPGGLAVSRIISSPRWANYDPSQGHVDATTGSLWRPFRAVDGTVVNAQIDPLYNPLVQSSNYWLNPYFNIVTTNEIGGAATGVDGRGAELFSVLTGVQSSGLGCGQRVQPLEGGGTTTPQCWIVIVPRGLPADENAGTPFEERADQYGVFTSPLSPSAWANRIAIPIEFNPVDSPCSIADVERRIAGNELLLPAVASWQPVLCTGGGLPPYSYAPVSDASARQVLVNPTPGSPGMVVTARAVAPALTKADNPIVYAPVAASGVVIGFNVERNPAPNAPDAAQRLTGVRVAEINLTPRLVAKLLSQSYRQAVTIYAEPDYEWLDGNPSHLGLDPDFLRFNPEFRQLQIFDSRVFSGLQVPAGNSDAAQQLWEWILADPEAVAWLAGQADEWGMQVNPYYSTDASANPLGIAFADPSPASFPKADPYCYEAPARGPNNSIVPPLLCGTDWIPYARGFNDAALITRTAFDGARISENPFAQSSTDVWIRGNPQIIGRRSMLSLTDTPSAAQFGVQMARLSRAGDAGDDREFVAPDLDGLGAAVAAMGPSEVPEVLRLDPMAVAPGAYPLTLISYAAAAPLSLDDEARSEYAAFVDYAVGAGQVSGPELGQLPAGYVPLPAPLIDAARSAATTIRELQPAPPPPPTPVETSTTTTVPPPAPVAPTPVSNGATAASRPASGGARPTSSGSATVGPEPAAGAPVATAPPTTEPAVDDTVAPEASLPEEAPAPTAPPAVTPSQGVGGTKFAIPLLGGVALISALGALELTKRPRRAIGQQTGGEVLAVKEVP